MTIVHPEQISGAGVLQVGAELWAAQRPEFMRRYNELVLTQGIEIAHIGSQLDAMIGLALETSGVQSPATLVPNDIDLRVEPKDFEAAVAVFDAQASPMREFVVELGGNLSMRFIAEEALAEAGGEPVQFMRMHGPAEIGDTGYDTTYRGGSFRYGPLLIDLIGALQLYALRQGGPPRKQDGPRAEHILGALAATPEIFDMVVQTLLSHGPEDRVSRFIGSALHSSGVLQAQRFARQRHK